MSVRGHRPQSWGILLQLLHWTTVLMLVGLFTSGWNQGMHGISSLHLTLGILLAPVVTARIIARLLSTSPVPLAAHPAAIQAYHVNQVVLYIALLAALITGLMAFSRHPLIPHARLFGTLELPGILRLGPEVRRAAAQAHGVVIWILLLAAAIHVGAVLGHVILTDRRAIRRMAGWRRDESSELSSPELNKK